MRTFTKKISAIVFMTSCMGVAFAQDSAADSNSLSSLLNDKPGNAQPVDSVTPTGGNNVNANDDARVAAAKARGATSVENNVAEAKHANVPEPATKKAVAVDNVAAAKVKSSNRLIEEIIVTATKRKENNQDVPIAISAFSGNKLNALGIQNVKQLPQITPGLTYTTSEAFPQIFLRGVGSDAFLPSADPTVPVYLDGVALLSGHGVSDTFGRISRVEVIKGPQGTLFGRDAVGGAINIVTPDPTPNFGGDIQQEIGNLGMFNTTFFINLPIVEGLGATVAGYNEVHDTYVQNTAGATVDSYARGGRVKIVWQALDNLKFNVSGQYDAESSNTGISGQMTRVNPDFALVLPQDPKLDYKISENELDATVSNGYVLTGGVDWNLPWVELKVIASDQKQLDTYIATDYDGGPLPLVGFDSPDEVFTQATAELQILSTDDTPLNKYFSWVAGAYYLEGNGGLPDLDLRVAPGGLLNLPVPGLTALSNSLNAITSQFGFSYIPGVTGPITAVSGGMLSSRSISGYFQGTTHLSEIFGWSQQVNLITGARLDRETRGLSNNFLGITDQQSLLSPAIHLLPFDVPKISAFQVPLKAELQWFPTDTTQIYASFSRGFTAPTYSTVNFFSAPPPIQPEKVNSYEIGAKLGLFDQTVTLNVALFDIQLKELLTGFTALTSGGIVEFDNAAAGRSRGIEADVTWQPLPELDPGLALFASGSYLDAKYTDYPNGRGYDTATGLAFGPPSNILGIQAQTLPARDFSGNNITRTPNFSYNIAVNQSLPVGNNGRVELNVSTNYSASYFNDGQNSPLNETPSFQLVDITGSYFYRPWGLEVSGYVHNLTKAIYPQSVFLLDTGRFQTPNDPRTYGLRIKYTF